MTCAQCENGKDKKTGRNRMADTVEYDKLPNDFRAEELKCNGWTYLPVTSLPGGKLSEGSLTKEFDRFEMRTLASRLGAKVTKHPLLVALLTNPCMPDSNGKSELVIHNAADD